MKWMYYHTAYYVYTIKPNKYIFNYSYQKDMQQLQQTQLQK